ncbi:hypothetical protein JXA12_00305 [Candidatus Woesearchaeota archaeon]|nr:hypothetical protein [Candidatus Woesearchaeota archaeon]
MERLIRSVIILAVLTLFVFVLVTSLFDRVTGGECGRDCACRGGVCVEHGCPANTTRDFLAACPGEPLVVCCVPAQG